MSSKVVSLHSTYGTTTGIRVAVTPATERWWYDAIKAGMHPSDLTAALPERIRQIKKGDRNQACLLLRNVCGSDEAITNTMNEAQLLKAKAREPKVDKGKASVLKATGRQSTPWKDVPAVKVGVPLDKVIAACREAIEKGE